MPDAIIAMLVLSDADVEAAVEGAVWGGFFNNGQVCAAASRIPVHESLHDEFLERFVEAAKQIRVGDPMNPETQKGYYLAPTIFADALNAMTFMQEEIFGPVVGVARFKDDAVAMANGTNWGLPASVWTKDFNRGLGLARQLQMGTVRLNEHLMVFCEVPWGGCKESGYGKDLSTIVLEEYTNVKHVHMDMNERPVEPW